MDAEDKARKAADAQVRPTQALIKPGQYFINFRYWPELPIFGEILDIEKLGHNDEEQEYMNESYETSILVQPVVKPSSLEI